MANAKDVNITEMSGQGKSSEQLRTDCSPYLETKARLEEERAWLESIYSCF